MNTTETIQPARRIAGEIEVPGDKSISHRSVMFGALARGRTLVTGFLQGEDNYATLNAFRMMGVSICECGEGRLEIDGAGLDGLREPADVLDCGNSGTTMRLMAGLLSGQNFFAVLTGDQYLRRRPMRRVTVPLRQMGARIQGREDGEKAPLAIQGGPLSGIAWNSPVASAQVKSALLLAGLYAEGPTTVFEPHLSRDHSERMLSHFGARVERLENGVRIEPRPDLRGGEIAVPGDISSAAFLIVAALIVPGSELLIRNVGVNPTRSGIIDILQAMGGDLKLENFRERSGEPVADLLVRHSRLEGIEIGGELIPRAIDELPVVSVAAAFAEGETLIRDARELRVKETDRIAAMVSELDRIGAEVEALEDGMRIVGCEQLAGGEVDSWGDHRIAMSMAVAGLRCREPLSIGNTACTRTSFPGFWDLLRKVSHD
ncbi:3-phosphoshikimate 1-carboxyvinyltransferase [Geothermobacter ehrlichii]|uniref:3-phosphoshikimate 1-carboxyvinyltransferase n=1 Tax=Geothermobacter ehrlichii TaxID=213224 RepID=A0A5D3WNC4_9BACT|nr:3-phosphoshikimate 1-carboxyvinyltransferase [Geothermobacter ehrlichii]TYO99568.1 3-phosphoshikimate 1-carboxyvinyltransferase [Geothermobacter ehrlichii]